MIHKIFAIYDSKARAYLQPFFAVNASVALRSFERAVNDERSDFHAYAGDYELFELGEFDDFDGCVDPAEHKSSLGLATLFLKPKGGV